MNGTALQTLTRVTTKKPAPTTPKGDPDSATRCTSIPAEGSDMEPRIAELEAHLKSLHKNLYQARDELQAIRYRVAYSTGILIVIIGLASWIANSRFDQLLTLLN